VDGGGGGAAASNVFFLIFFCLFSYILSSDLISYLKITNKYATPPRSKEQEKVNILWFFKDPIWFCCMVRGSVSDPLETVSVVGFWSRKNCGWFVWCCYLRLPLSIFFVVLLRLFCRLIVAAFVVLEKML